MNLQEMIARQQQITDLARAEGRDLTAEEQNEFDNLQRQINEAQPGPAGARSTPEPSEAGQGRDDDVGLERQRCADIIALCRDFNVDPTNYIRNNTDIGTVRTEILNQMRGQHPPVSTGVRVTADEADKFRAAASDALLMRSSLSVQNPEEGATELRAMSIRELGLECLRMDGQESSMRMNNDQLFDQLARQFFNPTASFPAILDQTIRKAYVHGYDTVGATFDRWVSTGSLPNFLESKAGYMAGSAGEFLLVPESGELKADLPKDHLQPTRKLDTYGRQFSMSRQAFINDDIGYLTTIPARYAAAARTTINNQVYGILTGNPVIYDGVELFHAAHGNLVETGTDLTAEAVLRA
ncbi:MAG: hypothetical protein IJ452_06185, partial [Butyricicoccus sp.]|nr:hypothetical protein [Butyricicoccus sp.]